MLFVGIHNLCLFPAPAKAHAALPSVISNPGQISVGMILTVLRKECAMVSVLSAQYLNPKRTSQCATGTHKFA